MKTNIELARECGATTRPEQCGRRTVVEFFSDELDDFAGRIKADAMAEYAATAPGLLKSAIQSLDEAMTVSGRPWPVLVVEARDLIRQHMNTAQPADLTQLHKNGAQAWADVLNATAWVDELRGGA